MIEVSRRRFLVSAAAAAVFPTPALAGWRTRVEPAPAKRLKIYCPRTDERFDDVYAEGILTYTDSLKAINRVMRDWRTDEVAEIDRELIELLRKVQERFDGAELTLCSGYRSPETNAMLRRRSKRVAKNSFHVKAMAADIRIKGISTSALRRAGRALKIGGVGQYPSGGFVHFDTGPVRFWRG